MGPLEIFGFIICLWALAFLVGLGLMMGMWAGIQAGTWAFGPIKVGGREIRVIFTDTHTEAPEVLK